MDRFRLLPNYRYYESSDGVITTAYEKPLRDYRIYGNSIQDKIPSPDNPIEIQSVGDYDEETGKYKIEIEVFAENTQSKTYNIFLDEPLRKCGDYVDYIDFKRGMVVRNTRYYDSLYDAFSFKNWGKYSIYSMVRSFTYLSVTSPDCIALYGCLSNCFKCKVTDSWNADVGYNSLVTTTSNGATWIGMLQSYVGASEWTEQTTQEEKDDACKTFILNAGADFQCCRITPKEAAIELPQIILNKGKNTIAVKTMTQPSDVSYEYYA